MNPALFLARKVQLLLIYVRGDGQLNQHQLNKHIYNFFVFLYPYPCIFLLVLHSSSGWRTVNPRGSRGGQADLGQPIAVVRPDGSLPGEQGFGSQKRPPYYLVYRASGEPPSVRAATHRARRWGYTVTCSCANISFKHMISFRFHLELMIWIDQLSNQFSFVHNDDVLKMHMSAHSILFLKTHSIRAQLPYDQSSDHSLNKTQVITWSSLFSSSYNLETNIWFKHCLRTSSTNITQCNH
jgi:hypothetical protein